MRLWAIILAIEALALATLGPPICWDGGQVAAGKLHISQAEAPAANLLTQRVLPRLLTIVGGSMAIDYLPVGSSIVGSAAIAMRGPEYSAASSGGTLQQQHVCLQV